MYGRIAHLRMECHLSSWDFKGTFHGSSDKQRIENGCVVKRAFDPQCSGASCFRGYMPWPSVAHSTCLILGIHYARHGPRIMAASDYRNHGSC